jgi:predicted RNase H-like nuclease (RuvC/YqgF family)
MSDNSYFAGSTPEKGSGSGNSRQRLITIAAVIIIALLGINVFLWINKYQTDRKNTELTTQLDETETLKAKLEAEYKTAIDELEAMKGENEELNNLIESQKKELRTQKSKIDQLLANKGSLDNARAEIRKLNGQIEQFLAEINQLRRENQELSATNMQLKEEKEQLSGSLEATRASNEQLSSSKAAIAAEKERVERERTALSKKVDRASMISAQGVEVTGLKRRDNGKSVKKNYADNVDQIQVCFNATPNAVAETGREIYYIRILSPTGETLAADDLGSGIFLSGDNEQIRYSLGKEFSYNGTSQKLCAVWSSNQSFVKGKYEVEIYNKGYLAGKGSVVLK